MVSVQVYVLVRAMWDLGDTIRVTGRYGSCLPRPVLADIPRSGVSIRFSRLLSSDGYVDHWVTTGPVEAARHK